MKPALVIALLAAGCSTSWDPHAPKTVTASGEGAPQRIVSYDVRVPETGVLAWFRSLFGRKRSP